MTSRPTITSWIAAFLLAAGCVAATPGAVPDVAVAVQAPAPAGAPVALPNKDGSLKFAVIGDFGTGSREQYQLAEQMVSLHARFPFELVLTVGDNIYGGNRPQDFVRKFETPYKPLLDAQVKFYASLGNHDSRQQSVYAPFNMGGRTYYTFKAPHEDVRFFALESSYLEPAQIAWLERELQNASEAWKIPYFHHPLYSSGGRHGSDATRRRVLEPLFVKYGVSIVLAGHDHVYERVRPQQGIVHFVIGSSGQLRRGNLEKTGLTAAGNDREQAFVAMEISGDELYFNAIGRTGALIDSGIIRRRNDEAPPAP
jgi:hypothetical protein